MSPTRIVPLCMVPVHVQRGTAPGGARRARRRWRGFCRFPVMSHRSGISNRETPEQEERERREHPPLDTGSAEPEDAAGRVGEAPLTDLRDRHTSHKAGSRSIAQKEDEARYPDRSMPAARKVAGAFGRE